MIKANELRIGNYVKGSEGSGFIQIEQIDEVGINVFVTGGGYYGGVDKEWDAVYEASYNQKNVIEPIPLTHDILEKAGFEMDASHQCPLWKNIKGFEFWDEYGTGSYSYRFMNNFDVEMKYVHQLQNLYFALTNSELEIKF